MDDLPKSDKAGLKAMTFGRMTTTSFTVYPVVAIIYSVTPFWVTKIRPLQPRQVVSCDKKNEGLRRTL